MNKSRLKKIEQRLAARPRMVWHAYTEEHLKVLRRWLDPKTIQEMRKKGGEFLPYQTPEEIERVGNMLTQRAQEILDRYAKLDEELNENKETSYDVLESES